MEAVARENAEKVASLLRGYFVAQAIYVAARLNVSDVLRRAGDLGMGVEELAAALGVQADSLYRVMRALASEGVYREMQGRRFALTPIGEMLRSDVSGSMRPAALIAGDTQYKVWGLLRECVTHGTAGFSRVFRKGLFEFFDEHPDLLALFNEAMVQRVERSLEAIVGACEVHAEETIVDVGGGLGHVLTALLGKHESARGVLLETQKVAAAAREAVNGVKRLEVVAGDYFAAVPSGDVMLLVTVLHMYQDVEAGRVLRNCRTALKEGGRLYVVERLIAGPNEADAGKWDDLNMMVMTGGRERTFEEFAGLLRGAGFEKVGRVGDGIVVAR